MHGTLPPLAAPETKSDSFLAEVAFAAGVLSRLGLAVGGSALGVVAGYVAGMATGLVQFTIC